MTVSGQLVVVPWQVHLLDCGPGFVPIAVVVMVVMVVVVEAHTP